MSFVEAVRSSVGAFSDFSGRSRRPEFWWFALFIALSHLALNSLNIVSAHDTVHLGASLSGAFGIVTLVPLLAVTVRRLRDAGRSWAELFWLLLPLAGLVVLIVHLAGASRAPGPVAGRPKSQVAGAGAGA